MERTLHLDKTPVKIQSTDFDGDGVINETESLRRMDRGITKIEETTELKDAIAEFNKDEKNMEGFSSVDFMGRALNIFEVPNLVLIDTCVIMEALPKKCSDLGRAILRKNVSVQGYGREGFIKLVTGKKEQDQMTGMQKTVNFTGFQQ